MRRSTVLLGSTIGFVALYAAATVSLGTIPEASDSGATVVTWFRHNGGHVRLWLLFATFALVVFAVYAAMVRSNLPAPHRDVFFVGAIVLVAESAVQGWFWGGLALHANQLEPATARTLLDVASYWGPLLTGATITMLAPVALLSFQRRAGLPMWLGIVTAVAVVEQAIETVTIFGHSGFAAPAGPMNLFLGASLLTIAVISLGVVVARSMPD
jgi:hypothetical protein